MSRVVPLSASLGKICAMLWAWASGLPSVMASMASVTGWEAGCAFGCAAGCANTGSAKQGSAQAARKARAGRRFMPRW